MSEHVKRPRGTGQIFQRGSTWWIMYRRNGKRYRESSGSEIREDADRLLKKRQGEIVAGKFVGLTPERVKLSRLLDLVIEDYEETGKRSTSEVKWRLESHVRPAIGALRAADFGSQQVKRYVSDRRRAGAAEATINRELSIVRRAFTLALGTEPPMVARAPRIPKLEEHNVREGFIEHIQYATIREALPDHLKALFVVGYHVGNRLGELRKLQWPQVDLSAFEIRLSGEQTKNKKPRTVPIYGDMKVWLQWQKELCAEKWPDCPWVFNYLGGPIGGHLKGWKRACEAAGLPELLFHDLRRSAVRNMVRAGIPEKVAMEITGHKTRAIFERYNIVSGADLATAAQKLEIYLTQPESLATSLATVKPTIQ